MTTLVSISATCVMCGTASNQTGVASTNAFGSPDLDLRPPEMQRSTMAFWVKACPHCGYVSSRLEAEIQDLEAVHRVMASPSWPDLIDNADRPPLVSIFLRHSLIRQALGDLQEAGLAALHAAWAADDMGDAASSAKCRRRAADLIIGVIKAGGLDEKADHSVRLQLIDVLRRIGSWEEAAAQCADLTGKMEEPIMNAVLAYQFKLIVGQDQNRHTVADANTVSR